MGSFFFFLGTFWGVVIIRHHFGGPKKKHTYIYIYNNHDPQKQFRLECVSDFEGLGKGRSLSSDQSSSAHLRNKHLNQSIDCISLLLWDHCFGY